ncbi:MAG: 23S rRNA (uracil(1939)-C(5))-methyltransferase RlmD [Oscillospiraceae bacterium]
MLKKNDIITLEITGFTNEGNGVGRHEGIAVFVPLTAVGDVISCRIVKVKKSFCYGIIDKLITPSDERCESGCSVYGKCGGCCFRHVNYALELKEKEGFVRDAFERIGKLSPQFEPIIGSEKISHYRNKAQFPVSEDENGRLYSGFFAKRSHRAIESGGCDLIPDIFSEICAAILDYLTEKKIRAYDEVSGKGTLRHIFLRRGAHSGEIMAALVVTSTKQADIFKSLADELIKAFPAIKSVMLNLNPERTNAILGGKSLVLAGRDVIYDEMCKNKIAISLRSFYQINTIQAERLYSLAADYAELKSGDRLLDLYCGAGTIGLSMASKVQKLIGVEIIPQAIEDAKKNAAANGITNAEFICADAGEAARILFERGESPDVIIADPARKGCTPDAIEYMVKMAPKKIVMISCNPSTAARDCALLEAKGYKAVKCRAVDLFPRTNHVECVVLMSRA